jgi:hypothetical protein
VTDWLNVPSPDGNVDEMYRAADQIEWYARSVNADAGRLEQIASATAAEWIGRAADQFHLQTREAHRSLDIIAGVHFDAARTIRSYAGEWDVARRASERAHSDIQHALDTYARDAWHAVNQVARHIEDFLDSNPVTDLLSHAVPQARTILNRLVGWNPPAIGPAYFLVSHADVVEHTAESIASHIGSGVAWGVSHLMDGIGAIAHLIGGAIHAAINAVHAVENALANAVAWALRTARNAIVALFDFGRRMVKGLVHLVSEAAKALYAFGSKLVHVVIQVLDWLDQWNPIRIAQEFVLLLGGVAVVAVEKYVFGRTWPRRMPHDVSDRIDGEAHDRFLGDPEYRRYMDERRKLEEFSYKYGGAPDGWERLDDIVGPEGFHAVVFRNPTTGEVVVAFRGSQGPGADFDMRDWSQDLVNEAGASTAQGEFAILVAKEMQAEYGSHLSFTGHSLGGSLAAMASIATGAEATTFNAAGIGDGNYALAVAAGGAGAAENHITNFHTTNDILTNAQEHLHLRPAAGAQVEVASNTQSSTAAHSLEAFVIPDYSYGVSY